MTKGWDAKIDEILSAYGKNPEGMGYRKKLRFAADFILIELMKRAHGEKRKLSHSTRELFAILNRLQKELILAKYGSFTTAYELYKGSDAIAVSER